ncbi:hypothetical protein NDA16_002350 [Ustilago loliicola]|nr:hypothetical protein NDA16_002350 [Ustilago loliicola]
MHTGRRSHSTSSTNNNIANAEAATSSTSAPITAPITAPKSSRDASTRRSNGSVDKGKNHPTAAKAIQISPRHQRHHSAESLHLDLDGLDLGGNTAHSPTFENAAGQPHVRSRSNNAAHTTLAGSKQPFSMVAYNGAEADLDPFCASCADEGRTHEAISALEDSFSLHLRAECSDYREIMSSQVVLNAAADKERSLRQAGLEPAQSQRSRGYSISHGQVLGGFASLGLQTETATEPPPPTRLQPVCTVTKGSTDSSEAPVTPIEWRDSFGSFGAGASAPVYSSPSKWEHLAGRPCNPLEPLDVLSIREMGFHSLDIGSLNDWEGCKLSAEILCPINGHQRIEWSVAQTTRRNKKWVVVPNATVTCGNTEQLTSAEQAERTVIVSARSLWMEEGEAQRDQAQPSLSAHSSQRQPAAAPAAGAGAVPATHRSSMPFSGKAGFELRLLRPTAGKICPPVYLANASTHRFLHRYRKDNGPQSSQLDMALIANPFAAAPQTSKASQPVYPVLRRSRSRPYLRHSAVPLRRSRSKPYLRASAQQQAVEASASRINPEEFAPSLPGDPLVRMHPGESWPSARARHSDSLSSFDSATSSDADSDISDDDDDAALSATNTRESSACYHQAAHKGDVTGRDGERARPAAIPMAGAGRAQRSLSPGSSASRGISSNSEASAPLAGWQHNSLESQRFQQQYNGSASYEADSWQGTSPTTASASSLSASSKQSRSRKGLQRALQKKDKMLSSWFKRRPEHGAGAVPAVSQGGERNVPQGSVSCPAMSTQGQISAGSSTRSSLARESHDGGFPGSTPLTESALESFQRAMFRPASPESTIIGSRRGSEALTQKTIEPAGDRTFQDKSVVNDDGFASKNGAQLTPNQTPKQKRTGGTDNRTAVNSTLTELYGWNQGEATSKLLRPPFAGTALSASGSAFQDLDEQNALLGLDAVPAGALTMLIPLPLIGRAAAQDAVRYMRVNFVPFGSFAEPFEAPAGGASAANALHNAGSPGTESDSGLSHSISTGSGSFGTHREALASSFASKANEQSGWKRKLGLRRDPNTTTTASNLTQAQQRSDANGSDAQTQSPAPAAFRITAIVHDAPWASGSAGGMDPRLPESGTFPVVLGYSL